MATDNEVPAGSAVITTPLNNGFVRNAQIPVSGTVPINNLPVVVRMYQGANTSPVATETATLNDLNWSAVMRGTFAPGAYRLIATQSGDTSINVTLRVTPVMITEPSSGGVSDMQFTVKGTGGEYGVGAITLHNATGGTLLSTATIHANGTWDATVTLPSKTDPLTLFARQKIGSHYSPDSNRVTVRFLSTPVIIAPAANTEQNKTFTLEGSDGVVGAKLEVLIDRSDTVVGSIPSLTAPDWRCTVNLDPGPQSLVARQTLDGKESSRSEHRLFKIKPSPVQSLVANAEADGKVTITGTALVTGVVDLHDGSNPTPLRSFTPGSISWAKTFTDWLPRTYSLRARQSVPDGVGGRIYSDYTTAIPLVVPVSRPTLEVQVAADRMPKFSGTGKNWSGETSRVEVRLEHTAEPIVPIANVVQGRWDSSAQSPWLPGKYLTTARQGVLDQWSSWLVESVEVVIETPQATIDTIEENELSPQVTGTCMPEADIELWYSDSPTKHRPSGANESYTFRRDEPFAPNIVHTVNVIQIVNAQPSSPVSATFTVHQMLNPSIILPHENEEVGRDVVVRGYNGMKGAVMRLFDAQFGWSLGSPKPLTNNGPWSIPLSQLDFRSHIIYAQQALNNRDSEPSDYRAFDVVLMPPEIEAPQPGQNMPRTSTLSGTAMPQGRVTVWQEGNDRPLLDRVLVDIDGRWKGEVTQQVGEKTIYAMQTFENQTSKESSRRPYNVVPYAPFIESPIKDQRVGRLFTVSGFAEPGDRVKITLDDAKNTVLGTAPVQPDRTWSVTVNFSGPGGSVVLSAVSSFDGFDSAPATRPVVQGMRLPEITRPAEGTWRQAPVVVQGTGSTGEGMLEQWFNPDEVLDSRIAVSDEVWCSQPVTSLRPGGQWLRYWQTITDPTSASPVSDYAVTRRFDVLPPKPPMI